MNRKIGRFWIDKEYIENNPDEVIEMFYQLKIIVIRAELLWHKNQIEYIGISEKFTEIEIGTVPFDYEIIVNVDRSKGKDIITFSIKEIKNGS